MASETAKVALKCEEAKDSQVLDLSYCDLRKFPDAVYFLMKGVHLQSLSLSHNDLKIIPVKLCVKFSTLTRLDLSFNQLTKLPEEISQIPLLSFLNISHNQIDSLPDSLPLLIELNELNMSYNQLSLCSELPPVTTLDCSHNCFTELPILSPSLSAVIKNVDLSHNRIEFFDKDQLLSIPWLECINLSCNPLMDELRSSLSYVIRIKIILEE